MQRVTLALLAVLFALAACGRSQTYTYAVPVTSPDDAGLDAGTDPLTILLDGQTGDGGIKCGLGVLSSPYPDAGSPQPVIDCMGRANAQLFPFFGTLETIGFDTDFRDTFARTSAGKLEEYSTGGIVADTCVTTFACQDFLADAGIFVCVNKTDAGRTCF